MHGSTHFMHILDRVQAFLSNHLELGAVLNLGALTTIDQLGITNFCWADCLRSVACTTATVFRYLYQPIITETKTTLGLEYTNSCPDVITVWLAETSNLRAAIDAQPTTSMGLSTECKARAADILQAVTNFRPSVAPTSSDAPNDSLALIKRVAIAELWRCTALIHFHQAIHRTFAASHPDLSPLLERSLKLCQIIDSASPGCCSFLGPLALPVFLAASVAVTEVDRAACRERLKGFGRAMVYRDNLRLIEEVWATSPKDGNLDWRTFSIKPAFM